MKLLAILTMLLVPMMAFGEDYYDEADDEAVMVAEEPEPSLIMECGATKGNTVGLTGVFNDCLRCHTLPNMLVDPADFDEGLPNAYPAKLIRDRGEIVPYLLITAINSDEVFELADYAINNGYKRVIIELFSGGGGVISAKRVIGYMDMMKNAGIIVESRCFGAAFSAAFVIFANGSIGHRYAGTSTMFMTHEMWSFSMFVIETPSDSEEKAEMMRLWQDILNTHLITRQNPDVLGPDGVKPLTKEWLNEVCYKRDHYLSGVDMRNLLGLADIFVQDEGYPAVK